MSIFTAQECCMFKSVGHEAIENFVETFGPAYTEDEVAIIEGTAQDMFDDGTIDTHRAIVGSLTEFAEELNTEPAIRLLRCIAAIDNTLVVARAARDAAMMQTLKDVPRVLG